MKAVGYIFTFLFMAILSTTYSGYALSVLYDWFIVTGFGVDSISIPTAIGVSIIVSYMATNEDYKSNDDDKSDVIARLAVKALLKPSAVLLVGWLVALFL